LGKEGRRLGKEREGKLGKDIKGRDRQGGYGPGNSMTLVRDARTLSDIMAVILDSKSEGAMVTTRMPCRARSRVMGRVSERIAPLEAA
jgi:hypothetical protein